MLLCFAHVHFSEIVGNVKQAKSSLADVQGSNNTLWYCRTKLSFGLESTKPKRSVLQRLAMLHGPWDLV